MKEENLVSKKKKDNLRRIAHMYYILQMGQQEISQKLGISRSYVAKYLAEARKCGLVQIHIVNENENVHNLREEGILHQLYPSMSDIYVISSNPGINFYNEAARYLDTTLPFHGSIGMGGGRTLMNIGESLKFYGARPNLKLVQLTGISREPISCMSTTQSWSDVFRANPYYIYSPDIEVDPEKRKVFLDDIAYKRAFEELQHLDMVIVSVGVGIDFERIRDRLQTSSDVMQRLRKDVTGDIVGHYFNKDGVFDFPEVSDNIIGITIEMMRKIPVRVCIAYGKEKAASIRAALKSGVINVLITDEDAAYEITNNPG